MSEGIVLHFLGVPLLQQWPQGTSKRSPHACTVQGCLSACRRGVAGAWLICHLVAPALDKLFSWAPRGSFCGHGLPRRVVGTSISTARLI